MAAVRPLCVVGCSLIFPDFIDLGWDGVETEHLYPFEASLFIVGYQGHDFTPF
jgi:hypothetical protein